MAERQGSVKGILKSSKDRSYKPKFQGDEEAVNRYVGPTILSLFLQVVVQTQDGIPRLSPYYI